MTAWPIVRRRSVESISIFLGGVAAMAKIDRCAFFLATGDVIRTPGRSVPVTFVILPRIQQRAKVSQLAVRGPGRSLKNSNGSS